MGHTIESIGLGYIKDPQDQRDHPIRLYLRAETIQVPQEKILVHPSPIRNQQALGSCVGFACAALKEWQEVQQRPGSPFQNVSEAWIYWKSKEIDPWDILEQGTSFRYALRVLQKIGVPTEKCWPYRPYNNLIARGKPKFYSKIVARWGRIDRYARINSIQQMKESICLHGPFVMGITCFSGIFNPTPVTHTIPIPSDGESPIGGHAILVMGYSNGMKSFRIRNSWGTNWADSGYAWLPYEYVEKYMLDAWTVVDDE